jgi:hypothetical protein
MAQTAGPGCSIIWDYSDAEQARISGFPVELNGKWIKLVPASERQVVCAELPLNVGANVFRIRARSVDGKAFSDWVELSFNYDGPIAAPQNVRVSQ